MKTFKADTIHPTEMTTKPVYNFMREQEASHIPLGTTKPPSGQVLGLFCVVSSEDAFLQNRTTSVHKVEQLRARDADAEPQAQKKEKELSNNAQLTVGLHREATYACTLAGSPLTCLYLVKIT